ncbi:MAG: C40 family peptidase [Ignavibacteriaceae bacterium]|nr:C40 family peptidase [Ignavibacteriaceae bacterium]
MKILIRFMMIGISGVILILGCSSSSNTVRFKPGGEQTEKDDSNTRFPSKDSKTSIVSDSSNNDEISDDADSEELPDQTQSLDISSILQKIGTNKDSKNLPVDNSLKEKMLMEIIKYLDTPYKFGGSSKSGIDCSAFTQTIFQNTFSVDLLRSARDQYTQGFIVDEREKLQFGDLVFFNTRRRVRPGHVGIYIGDNLFAHSSSKNGVIVSSLDLDYYSQRFMGGRRIEGIKNPKL